MFSLLLFIRGHRSPLKMGNVGKVVSVLSSCSLLNSCSFFLVVLSYFNTWAYLSHVLYFSTDTGKCINVVVAADVTNSSSSSSPLSQCRHHYHHNPQWQVCDHLIGIRQVKWAVSLVICRWSHLIFFWG